MKNIESEGAREGGSERGEELRSMTNDHDDK